MPAETAPQDRVWMAFPRPGHTLGDDVEAAAEAYDAWTAVAHAVLRFAPVTMVVDPAALPEAKRRLSAEIELLEAPLDDFWMRDIGPTFVTDGDRLGAVDWVFNGWGATPWTTWTRDREIGAIVGEAAGAEVIGSMLVNEGGAIHVDGEGTVLLTDTVQLDPGRNPWATKAQIERELARTIGATTAIWLPRGLTRDDQPGGTRGHVDMVAAFVEPGVVLLHRQDAANHPDHAVSRQLRSVLEASVDARGRTLEVIELPAPTTLTDDEGFVDWNYANHLVVNGGVIACGYDEPVTDRRAAAILAEAYGREVVTVDARPILARGGGIHCITQQQPAVSS